MSQLTYKHLAAALLVAFAGAASAQQDMTMTTTGTLTPGACSLAIAGGAAFAYGNLTPSAYRPAGAQPGRYELPILAAKNFSVTCASKMKVRLAVVDNNTAGAVVVAGVDHWFGVGTVGAEPLGVTDWHASNIVVDTLAQPDFIFSRDGGGSWAASPDTYLRASTSVSFITTVGSTVPESFTTASFDLQPRTYIRVDLPITTNTPLAGSMTISMTYL